MTDTRQALAALMEIAAECAQRKPLRAFEDFTEATHIGHRQFGRAYERADEDVRMLAVRLRAVFDALAPTLSAQPVAGAVADEQWRSKLWELIDAYKQDDDWALACRARIKRHLTWLAAPSAAPAPEPSVCGLTECKNKTKCDRCKAWDSMGI